MPKADAKNLMAEFRRGGGWRLLSADRKNAGGVATVVEDTDNFGAVIGNTIEDRVGMNRHSVYAPNQFGERSRHAWGFSAIRCTAALSSITRASAISGDASLAKYDQMSIRSCCAAGDQRASISGRMIAARTGEYVADTNGLA